MYGALSDPPHKEHVAGSVVWLHLLMYCTRPIPSRHIWHEPKLTIELGMSSGPCSSLLCGRVALYCTLRHIMQFLPELVKQCICVSLTKVMVGAHIGSLPLLPNSIDKKQALQKPVC